MHEGRFSRTVLSQQCVNGSLGDSQGRVVEGNGLAEVFGDPVEM